MFISSPNSYADILMLNAIVLEGGASVGQESQAVMNGISFLRKETSGDPVPSGQKVLAGDQEAGSHQRHTLVPSSWTSPLVR